MVFHWSPWKWYDDPNEAIIIKNTLLTTVMFPLFLLGVVLYHPGSIIGSVVFTLSFEFKLFELGKGWARPLVQWTWDPSRK